MFISNAYAQETAQATTQSQFMSFIPLILIFFVFYFLMIRPQKKKLENEAKFNASLDKGNEVYMKSGVIGKIVGLTEKVVTLEVSEGTKVKFLRSQIGGDTKNIFSSEAK